MRKALFLALFLAPLPLLAGFSVRLKTAAGEFSVQGDSRKGRIFLDVVQVVEALGGGVVLKDGEYVLSFSSGTAVVNPQTGVYRIRPAGKKKWKAQGLDPAPLFAGPRLMVGLDDFPALTFRPYTYHLQKKELTDESLQADRDAMSGGRRIQARRVDHNRKDWVALEDVAKALGVVIYSAQPQRYNLIMPDFTVLEVGVGEPWIYRRKQRYKLLEDPILVFLGAPYATPGALSALFDADIRWDSASGRLMLPLRYGRLKEASILDRKPLTVIGYTPQPVRAVLEEFSLFYQAPGPYYSSDHPDLYESVRDFLTNRVVDPRTKGYDRVSGSALLTLTGSFLGNPLDGGGRFEKVGTRGRTVNGSLQWGFPLFQMKASREYLRMGGFFNQSDLVDHVQVSHASDHFGEGKKTLSWKARVLAGRQDFSVFVSTEFFSQTVDFRQNMAGGALEGSWRSGRHLVSGTLTHYRFLNKVSKISQEYNFFSDLFGDDFVVDVDPAEAKALASSALTDHHETALLDGGYRVERLGSISAAGGMSRYRASDGRSVADDDWRLAGTLGEKRSRLTLSHERVGPEFRSIGNPLRYAGRRITRVSPYLDLGRSWKVSGEFRREDLVGADHSDFIPYRSDFFYATNNVYRPAFELRAHVNKSDHSLYGKRWSGGVDGARYLGRDSLEAGASWSSQWYGTGLLYRQSYTTRGGYQIQRPPWKLSVSEEFTRHHYPFYKLAAWRNVKEKFPDRWESLTHVAGQWGSWEGAAQYNVEPRYYRESETLHTGYFRVGRQVGERKVFNLYYAATALNRSFSHPQVWRLGCEYVNDFF